MSDEILAVNLMSRRFSQTAALFGVTLAANASGSTTAQLLIANAVGNQNYTSGNLLFTGTTKLGIGVTSPNARLEVTDTSTQLLFGTATDQGFLDASASGARLGFGARFDGTNWSAKKTTGGMMVVENGIIKLFTDTGLTVGANFTPTERARLVGGNLLIGTTTDNGSRLQVNGSISAVQPSGLGTGASANMVPVLNVSGKLPPEVFDVGQQSNVGIHQPPVSIGPSVAGQADYPLPGPEQYALIFYGPNHTIQKQGTKGAPASGDYYIENGRVYFFTPPASSGVEILASCISYFTASTAGGGAMTTPVELATTTAGVAGPYGPLPGSKTNPWVFLGNSALQIKDLDYTVDASGYITFTVAPTKSGVPISVSVAQFPLLNTDAETLGTHHAADFLLKGERAFASLRATGLLIDMIGAGDADEALVLGGHTLKKIAILCPQAYGSGTIEVDVLMQSVQGASDPVTLFTTKARPTVTCNDGRAWAILSGTDLPDITSIPDPAYLTFRVVSAPVGAKNIRVWLYE